MRADKLILFGAMASALALGACSKSETAGKASDGAAMADAQPMPKAGLWEMTVTAAGMPATAMRVCLGEPTPGSNPFAPPPQPDQACAKNDVKRTGAGYSLDMECASNGMTMAMNGEVTGDFTTSYRTDMTTTISGPNLPAGAQQPMKSSVVSKYVGACPAGMTPGQTAPVA